MTRPSYLILFGFCMMPLVGCGGGGTADVIADQSEVEAYLAEHGDQSTPMPEDDE